MNTAGGEPACRTESRNSMTEKLQKNDLVDACLNSLHYSPLCVQILLSVAASAAELSLKSHVRQITKNLTSKRKENIEQ